MIYMVDVDGSDYALFSTKEKADKYAESFKYNDGYVKVTPYEVDVEHREVPTRLNVSGFVHVDGSIDLHVRDSKENTAWKFYSINWCTQFNGSIDVIPGETPEHFYERTKEVVLEKYKESFHG